MVARSRSCRRSRSVVVHRPISDAKDASRPCPCAPCSESKAVKISCLCHCHMSFRAKTTRSLLCALLRADSVANHVDNTPSRITVTYVFTGNTRSTTEQHSARRARGALCFLLARGQTSDQAVHAPPARTAPRSSSVPSPLARMPTEKAPVCLSRSAHGIRLSWCGGWQAPKYRTTTQCPLETFTR